MIAAIIGYVVLVMAAVASQAVTVLNIDSYATNVCSSGVTTKYPLYLANGCTKIQQSSSANVDCAGKVYRVFNTEDCTGLPREVVGLNCTDATNPTGIAIGYSCQENVPASALFFYEKGASCAADGTVQSVQTASLMTTTGCIGYMGSLSYNFTVFPNNTAVALLYMSTTNCTGPISETIVGNLNQCLNGVKFTTVSGGVSFGLSSALMSIVAVATIFLLGT